MTSSASFPVREAFAEFLARRIEPERLVAAVVDAYYRQPGSGNREALKPIVEVIERAAPGVVELSSRDGRPGFEVRAGERPFPKQYEQELRRAVAAVLAQGFAGDDRREIGEGEGRAGLVTRLLLAIQRLFR